MSINRSGETTVELATCLKIVCFLGLFKLCVQFYFYCKVYVNATNNIKKTTNDHLQITQLQVNYKNIISSPTNAKLSRKWSEVTK